MAASGTPHDGWAPAALAEPEPIGQRKRDHLSGRFAAARHYFNPGTHQKVEQNVMDSEWIIGALAVVTIGGVVGIAVFHFGYYLKDPRNMEATKRVMEDEESATTRVSNESKDGRSLRQRLNDAPGINDRLSRRPTGLNPWDAFTSTSWSTFRGTLKGDRRA